MSDSGAYDDLRAQVNDLTDEVDLYLGKLSEAESEAKRLREYLRAIEVEPSIARVRHLAGLALSGKSRADA
jgi:hypothetical protein